MEEQIERKKDLLTSLGYKPLFEGSNIYTTGLIAEVINGEEPFDSMRDRLNAERDKKDEEKKVEQEKVVEEEIETEYILETEQQYYAAEWVKQIQTPTIYRMTVAGKRVYYEIGADGYPILYDGATNNIANGYCDQSGALEKWKAKMRLEGKDPDEYANYRADFGTVMHYMYGLFLTGTKMTLVPSYIKDLVMKADVRVSKRRKEEICANDIDELIDDILSFAIFCKERNVKPVLIEKMLRLHKLKIASSVDAVVEMDSEPEVYEVEVDTGEVYKTGPKKGQPKMAKQKIRQVRRIFAILDFKSGKNFYDEYALQLELYRRMMRENYGKLIEIEEMYNFAPGDPSSKTVKYKLKRQTDNPILDLATVVYIQGKKKFEKTDYKVRTRVYEVSLEGDLDIENAVRTERLADYIYRIMQEREKE